MSKKRCEKCNNLFASNHTEWGYICNSCQSRYQKQKNQDKMKTPSIYINHQQSTPPNYVHTATTNGTYGGPGPGGWMPNTLGTPQDLYIQQQLQHLDERMRQLMDRQQALAIDYSTLVGTVLAMKDAMKEQTECFKDLIEALE